MAHCWIAALLLLFAGAQTRAADDFPIDQAIARVSTLASADHQYALYLPPGYDVRRQWPLLVLLDPRGRAEPTLARTIEGARRNGWIVMSSYQSRSDTLESITLLALQALLDESDKRFSADRQRLYLAGMSGTAKSLWTVVPPLRGSLAGMIGCAGGRSPDASDPGPATPPFYGCTGRHDFNHREMLELDEWLAGRGAAHRLQRFDGGHGWPPDLGPAIDWLQLMAVRSGQAPRDPAWLAARFEAEHAAAQAIADPYTRWLALSPLPRDYAGLVPIEGVAAEVAALASDPPVKAGLARERELAKDEARYAAQVNEWFGRMLARFPDGRPQDPPTQVESLKQLKVRTLRKLTAGPDAALADSARRRLELAYAAANSYLPREAEGRGQAGHVKASRAVARAIFPERQAATNTAP